MANINRKNNYINRLKKLVLLNMYTLTLVTSSLNVNAKENSKIASAGVIKVFSDNLDKYFNNINESLETKKELETSSAGVSKVLSEVLENILKDDNLSAGITSRLSEILEYSLVKAANNEPELENMEAEKTYYDFPCTQEFQDYIIKTSEENGVPYEIVFTILHQESDGQWNSNGVVSPTGDYGVAQINICNHNEINKNLGISQKEILNNPYKAVEAQVYLLKNIMNYYGYTKDNFDYANIFGAYNGWIYWYYDKKAQVYVDSCLSILNEKFGIEGRKLK